MDLKVFAVCKSYGDVEALKYVELKVEKGEFFTLLGPSGCGKTTLLRVVAGLEMADSGMVMLGGEAITWKPANERPVNTVFQSYALFPHLTVLENISFGLISRKIPKAEAIIKAKEMLDLVQLDGFGDRKPDQMSGGQRQRVALARALANEPELLLLDEPMSALDAKLRVQVQIELRQIQQRLEKTFIMVTHDQQEALTVSDRMAVMNVGEVAQMGDVREVYDRPKSKFVADFLQTQNFIEAERVADHRIRTTYGEWAVTDPVPWEKGTVTVRPENLSVTSDSAACTFKGRVETSLYRGCYQELFLDNGLQVETESVRPFAKGEEVMVNVPQEAVVMLND
ncbi:ABC transporter ATP-binding protein [Pontiellaceae bacterium B12219]|nr:ABC transporter ATP-binding protein [Pontiellaceae bacterium B12219]